MTSASPPPPYHRSRPGRATLPWVPTMSRRQRRTLAARISQPSRTHHLAAALP